MIIKLLERLGRRRLNSRGIQSRWVDTPAGRVHFYDGRGPCPKLRPRSARPGHLGLSPPSKLCGAGAERDGQGPGILPPVVLLHGLISSATVFSAVMLELLRQGVRRVLAVDAPGHGFSGKPAGHADIAEFMKGIAGALDQELDEPAVFFGNSLGGVFAVQYGLMKPEKVKGLVLASPAGAPLNENDREFFSKLFEFKSLSDVIRFQRMLYFRPPWYMLLLAPAMRRLHNRSMIKQFLDSLKPEDHFQPGELGSLAMPVLLIWGKSDTLMPGNVLEFFKRHLPVRSIIEEPEGFGHCPHFDDPIWLAGRIAAFARSISDLQ